MAFGGIIRFSDILKTANSHPEFKKGCVVDTSILFAASYTPDFFNKESEELFEYLAELEIPLFTNINIRSEFMNKQRQVMIPEGLSDLYTSFGKSLDVVLYSKLQSNYTTVSEGRKTGKSYKLDENQIKSQIIGQYGIASSDAMIINLFLNSHFPAIITADGEIAYVVEKIAPLNKFVIIPDKL